MSCIGGSLRDQQSSLFSSTPEDPWRSLTFAGRVVYEPQLCKRAQMAKLEIGNFRSLRAVFSSTPNGRLSSLSDINLLHTFLTMALSS